MSGATWYIRITILGCFRCKELAKAAGDGWLIMAERAQGSIFACQETINTYF